MTDTALISFWLEKPALLKQEPDNRLHQLSIKFPLFTPMLYLKAIQSSNYNSISLNILYELFPANRVLIYELFKQREASVVHKEQEPLYPDNELKQANAGGQDYFTLQGIAVETKLPPKSQEEIPLSQEKDLMVVMSFSEWLRYLENRSQKAKDEEASKSALRAMWQKQKLTAAIEEEEEEIPENVFEMAVNSITAKEELISESMATVYALQGKKEKAMEMYKKLSLQIPEKSAYFAKKVETLQKEIDI